VATYDGTINVNANSNQVWDLVAHAENFQRYFPHARARQDDRLLVEWSVSGPPREERLWFKQLPEERRVEWGSENNADNFHGYVDIHQLDARTTEVDMHLDAPMAGQRDVEQTVRQALSQIKQTAESDSQ
jgi:uncharacterized membrane protein